MSPRELRWILTRLFFSAILYKNLLEKFIYKYNWLFVLWQPRIHIILLKDYFIQNMMTIGKFKHTQKFETFYIKTKKFEGFWLKYSKMFKNRFTDVQNLQTFCVDNNLTCLKLNIKVRKISPSNKNVRSIIKLKILKS